MEERCLPESVRGPVECRELTRLMAVRDVARVADIWRPRNRDNTWRCRQQDEIGLGC
jgi:hypothetical protein